MGFMLFDNNPNYGAQAARSERGRQALINSGMQSIDAVFGGGSIPGYSLASGSFDPTKQYYSFKPGYNKNGGIFKPWNVPPPPAKGNNTGTSALVGGIAGGPFGAGLGATAGAASSGDWGGVMTQGLSSLFGGDEPPNWKAEYPGQIRKGSLYTKGEDKTFQGFSPNFYEQRKQDYYNYALPQLAQQYDQARRETSFGLANRGLVDSSAAQQKYSTLNRQMDQNRQSIADQGVQQANSLREQVEQAKQNLIAQLYQTANPSQGLSSAINTAANFQAPTAFAPLTNMFGNLAQQYYMSQALNNGGGSGFGNYQQPPVYYGFGGSNVGDPYNSVKT